MKILSPYKLFNIFEELLVLEFFYDWLVQEYILNSLEIISTLWASVFLFAKHE